jgi:hypothetical protein
MAIAFVFLVTLYQVGGSGRKVVKHMSSIISAILGPSLRWIMFQLPNTDSPRTYLSMEARSWGEQ